MILVVHEPFRHRPGIRLAIARAVEPLRVRPERDGQHRDRDQPNQPRPIRQAQHKGRDQSQKAKQGGQYIYKEEFVKGWERFAATPCLSTAIQLLREAPDYSKLLVEHIFLPACPGGMSHTLNELKNRSACFPPSVYPFDSEIAGVEGFSELSVSEYQVFPRSFRGEVIYNAPNITFLDRDWKVMVGVVDSKVYNVAASHNEGGSQEAATEYLNKVIAYCSHQFGLHSERRPGCIMWDLKSGSVSVQFGPIVDELAINMFSTSKAMRGFKKV